MPRVRVFRFVMVVQDPVRSPIGRKLLVVLDMFISYCYNVLILRCKAPGVRIEPLHPNMSYEATIGDGWVGTHFHTTCPWRLLLQVNEKVRARVVTGSKPAVVDGCMRAQGTLADGGRTFLLQRQCYPSKDGSPVPI